MHIKVKSIIIITLLLLFTVYIPANATVYFYFDAESCTVGTYLPNPPWSPCCSTPEQSRGYCVADNTMQGNNIVQWNVPQGLDHQINYTSLTTQPAAPFGTYYYAFFFRFDRINVIDIWNEGNFSYFDKVGEVDGDGVRWVINFGERAMINQDHNFSVFITNPTYHLNPALEISDSYFQNYGGYSRTNSIQLGYEKWHSIVFGMKWATDNTGEISLWINGIKVLQYLNIRTAQAPGTIAELGWNGTYAQPAYDIPAHYRKFDAIIFTDNWQDIVDGGYLSGSGSGDIQAPSVPAGLSAQAISSSQINLSWTASTDNVGVTGYRIYRCTGSSCTPSTQITTSTINSYQNTGLAANTTYVYRVAAYDAAGNVSSQSSSATAATQAAPDTTPPSPPTGLIIQ